MQLTAIVPRFGTAPTPQPNGPAPEHEQGSRLPEGSVAALQATPSEKSANPPESPGWFQRLFGHYQWYQRWDARYKQHHWQKALDILGHPAFPPTRQDYEQISQIRHHLRLIRRYYPVRDISPYFGERFYPRTFTYDYFLSQPKMIAAIKYQSIAMGEMVKQMSPEFQKALKGQLYMIDTPWEQMKANRDNLLHKYFKIEPLHLWWAVRRQYPHLQINMEMVMSLIWKAKEHLKKAGKPKNVDLWELRKCPEVKHPQGINRGDRKQIDMKFLATQPTAEWEMPNVKAEKPKRKPEDKAFQTEKRTVRALNDLGNAVLYGMEFVDGLTFRKFKRSSLDISAICYQIGLIGSIVKDQLPADFKAKNSQVPWAQIARMRNIVSHRYDDVDFNILWKTATESLPELLDQIRAIFEVNHNYMTILQEIYSQKSQGE